MHKPHGELICWLKAQLASEHLKYVLKEVQVTPWVYCRHALRAGRFASHAYLAEA